MHVCFLYYEFIEYLRGRLYYYLESSDGFLPNLSPEITKIFTHRQQGNLIDINISLNMLATLQAVS